MAVLDFIHWANVSNIFYFCIQTRGYYGREESFQIGSKTLAGVFGNTMAQGIQETVNPTASKSAVGQLRELKELLDEGILTQDEFDAQKKTILGKWS